jgi:hypothetical protein
MDTEAREAAEGAQQLRPALTEDQADVFCPKKYEALEEPTETYRNKHIE